MPRPLIYLTLILIALSFIPLALLARSRVAGSVLPRLQIVPDMDDQFVFKTQSENPLFADGRAMRPTVPGTVARGELQDDDHYYRGRQGEAWAATSPVPLTGSFLERGRERFDIFCATCHGLTGSGDGMVSRRADKLAEGTWTPPTNLTSSVVRERPDGQLYHIISHGIRNMPAYGPQIPVADRWAIVAYVRALQRSAGTSIDDVPEDIRPTLR